MGSEIASAFQSGSGIDPSALKVSILSITAAMTILVVAWIFTRLFHDWQDDRITLGEFVLETLLLMAILTFMLWFLTMY